jgi:hypothetical protein
LVVSSRAQSELDDALTAELLERDQIAGVEFEAIASDHVDLFCGVATSHQPIRCPSARIAPNNHNLAVPRRPLALDAFQPPANVENEVVTASFANGPVDVDAELNRRERIATSAMLPF